VKFKFSLEKVLQHRKNLEDEARRNFLLAQAQTVAAVQKQRRMYEAIDKGREFAKGQSIATLRSTEEFVVGQKIRIAQQRDQVRKLKEHEERLQDLLVLASQERKTLEKLKEKKLLEFKELAERRERAELDDMTIMRSKRAEGP
jgi:flagellar protein FliJ